MFENLRTDDLQKILLKHNLSLLLKIDIELKRTKKGMFENLRTFDFENSFLLRYLYIQHFNQSTYIDGILIF